MNVLSFNNVSFAYPGYQPVLNNFSASLQHGEIVCVIGPSGCGKSTLLNLAGGFIFPGSGIIEDKYGVVSGPGKNRIMVFQNSDQLFPWLTTSANVKFPLKYRNSNVEDISIQTENLLELVGLSDDADLFPSQLSGGMKQRAVIARALSTRPDILLLDEPFTALDAPTRRSLQDLLVELNRGLDTSMLFVTHDITEAVYIADRLIILKNDEAVFMDIDIERISGRRDEYSDDFVSLERRLYGLLK